jgi:hypothetical protein
MQHFPTTAAEVEDAYRRERSAAHFHVAGGRSERANRGLAGRVRWRRRRDQTAC